MREVLAVATVSLLTGLLFGVAGPVGVERPPPPKPGIAALQEEQGK